MRNLFFLIFLFIVFGCELNKTQIPYRELNASPAGDFPSVFAPGIITTNHHEHSAPAISPDGKEIYWSVWEKPSPANPVQKIFYIEYSDTGWSTPKVAPFSGKYSDGGPCFSPDGQKLFFYSQRPVDQDSSAKGDIDIWFVERANKTWLKPERMSSIINDDRIQASPSVSANNNLYLLNYHENVKHNYGIYKSVYKSGNYTKPVPLPKQINSIHRDWTPFISPGEDFIIFSSHRPGGYGSGDLYISFKTEDGNWSEAINLGEPVNTSYQERFPILSPDGEVLFFTRSTDSTFDDIFRIKSDFIQKLKLNAG